MAEAAFDMESYTPRLQTLYRDVVIPKMKEDFGYANPMVVPRLEKVVLNMGIGEAVGDSKKVQSAAEDLALIAGQKPVITRARKSIATFKLREGMAVGTKVTLRRERMFEFIDRLINVALPRVRDFRGLNPKSFDGRGNYTFGLTEQLVFPEIDYDDIDAVRGMDITLVMRAEDDAQGRAFLDAYGFPFVKS